MNNIAVFLCGFLIGAVPVLAQSQGRQVLIQPEGAFATIDTGPANRAIRVLAKGSDAEKDAMVARMEKSPGDYAPPVFMFMAIRLYDKGDSPGAYFWFSFGRLRGRYDAARCADVSARQEVDVLAMYVRQTRWSKSLQCWEPVLMCSRLANSRVLPDR